MHDHVRSAHGRTRVAQVYPPGLCHAMCKGVEAQIEVDRKGQLLRAGVNAGNNNNAKSMVNEDKKMQEKHLTADEDCDEELAMAWDDVSGAVLDPKKVREARAEEVQYVRDMNLYTKVPTKQWAERIGKQPIGVRWIDINKGDSKNPNYRSRLVAREINTYKRDDLFAATPPHWKPSK